MSEERCVFPNSNNSVFSPTRSFPWHEERFGNQDLHTKLWKIFEKLERKECDKKKFQLTFKEVVKKILVGRQINLGIQVNLSYIFDYEFSIPSSIIHMVCSMYLE